MITLTEKTADKICQEFRDMIQAIDERLEEEEKLFIDVSKELKGLKKGSYKYAIAELLYNDLTKERAKHRTELSEEKKKFIGFIEVLMVGESA